MTLAGYTRNERRYLSRHLCGLCEIELHRDYCGALDEKCTTEQMETRRRKCLQEYRPRHKQALEHGRGEEEGT